MASADRHSWTGSYVAALFQIAEFARISLFLMIGGNVAEKPIANQIVLAILPAQEDRTSLASIFAGSNWKVQFASELQEAQTALRGSPGVVISEGRLSDGYFWKDLLLELQKMKDPPPLIVADRLADEYLWAEVLNLGGHDLLAKPFDAREVLHAVTTACRRSENQTRDDAAPESSMGGWLRVAEEGRIS